ncbi:zinc finger protein 280D [Pelodytes ibericus]
MAELLMECEEEELEPWQQRIKEVEDDDDDDDDDEPIFVREISGSKPTNRNNTAGTQHGSFPRVENGTPTRGAPASFQPSGNHYKTPAANTLAKPATPVYQPATRPAASSAIVQPLPRPTCTPEPIKRPPIGCLPAHQTPRANPPIIQSVCRPATMASNSQTVCRNITFPAMAQSAVRPVATITAQPVMLNQGYIVNSPQVSSSNSLNVMYALRPGTALTQYPGVQAFSATGNSSPLVRPLQPLTQIRPVSTPLRTIPTIVHRPSPRLPSVTQNNLMPMHSQPILLNSHKNQQGVHGQSSPVVVRNENALMDKRQQSVEITSVSPKKPKTSENGPDCRPVTTLPFKSTTPSQGSPLKVNVGTTSGTTPTKNGAPFPRACPKCNIHFNLIEPMKRHMKYCCPDKMHYFFLAITNPEITNTKGSVEEMEKGKLIMLVNDFYYGRHPGNDQLTHQERKTNTTFKCFSCHKILKNNIRFMNHMKHHLELEKQSTESWENHTTCHHCYRQFPTPFQLQCHIESSHTLYESTTICKICELSFESEQVLLQHMKDNHKPGEMPYVCQVCNYRSSTFMDVDKHFRNAHENTKNLLCPFCLKVIKSAASYMQHYMKHQNKGVYRCAKCRLQFLTCKEKMDHKTQHHRTFRKPKQLEGLPPGTKVTIRASVGSINNSPCPTASVCTSPTSTPLQASSKGKKTNIKTIKTKSNLSQAPKHKQPPVPKKLVGMTTTKRIKMINTALRNLRSMSGFHKCIECQSEVKDFESHFHTYVHCSKCKFSTSCNKAYMNHMVSFHGRNSNKRSKDFKKAHKNKRRITLVCLNCDFLADVSGLNDMAKHLGEIPTHSCQVIMETVSIFSSTLEGDISKSRYELPVEQRHQYCKVGLIQTTTNSEQAKKNDTVVEKKKESNINESIMSEQLQRNIFLQNRQITCEEPANNSDKIILDNCLTNKVMRNIELYTDNKNNCSTIQVHYKDGVSLQSPEETTFTVNTEEAGPALEPLEETEEDHKDLNNTGDEDVSFEQFLRQRNEPDSVSSDISEQSSVHLEPLTPSEVLEHEATEILQKGNTASSPKKCLTSEKVENAKETSTQTVVVNKTEEDGEQS